MKRTLGRTDLAVSPICFGAWALGGTGWGEADDAASVAAIRAGFEAGITAVDTAPVYGFGRSERVVGEALRDPALRGRLTVLTKVGIRWDDEQERGAPFFQARIDGRRVQVYRNSRPDSLRLEVERSLARLGVEALDLAQVHWPDPTTPLADSLGTLVELRAAGKLCAIGVSNFGPALLDEARAALGDVPLASVQSRYSLVHREIEAAVLPYAREHGLGVLAYSPLGRGILTGRVTLTRRFPRGDQRRGHADFRPWKRWAALRGLRRAVAPVARAHGVTPGQVVLAWTAAQPGITGVLAGARTAEQARENAAAMRIELAPEELRAIAGAFAGPRK